MRLVMVLLGAVLLPAAGAPAASAAGGFGEPVAIGAGSIVAAPFLGPPVAALGAGGDGAIAWVGDGRVRVARRMSGGPWRSQIVARRADEVPDLQLAVTPAGATIVAWTASYAAARHLPDRLYAATARRGRRFQPQVLASGPRADAAVPRMAVLGDGRVALVWRAARSPSGGRLQLSFVGANGRFGRPRAVGADGVAPAIAATSDGGGVVAWATPAGFHESHALRAARLPAGARRLGRSFEFSSSAVEGARLAAGPDGVVIASWASKQRPVGLLSAQLSPRLGPARVLRPGARAANGPPIAVGPGGFAVATFVAATRQPQEAGSRRSSQWVAAGTAAGGLRSREELVTPGGSLGVGPASPTILPSGEALVVWSQDRPVSSGRLIVDVFAARRPPGATAFASIERLGAARPQRRTPIALARFDAGVLVAWPAPGSGGGMLLAERR